MTSINNLNDIVNNGLCIGCGLCQSIAGKENIEISMTPKGRSVAMISNIRDEYLVNLQKLRKKYENKIRK